MSEKLLARASFALSVATVANVAELANEIVDTIAGGEDVSNQINGEKLTGDAVRQAVQVRLAANLRKKGVL